MQPTESVTVIRPFTAADRADCAAVFATLPDWFGLPEANAAYLADLDVLPAWVAARDERIVGFASMRVHNPSSVELEVIAVEHDQRRRGIGRRLLAAIEDEIARRPEIALFHVKTRGATAFEDAYDETRRFYAALGFKPLFETDALWGPENPALIMVRPVQRVSGVPAG